MRILFHDTNISAETEASLLRIKQHLTAAVDITDFVPDVEYFASTMRYTTSILVMDEESPSDLLGVVAAIREKEVPTAVFIIGKSSDVDSRLLKRFSFLNVIWSETDFLDDFESKLLSFYDDGQFKGGFVNAVSVKDKAITLQANNKEVVLTFDKYIDIFVIRALAIIGKDDAVSLDIIQDMIDKETYIGYSPKSAEPSLSVIESSISNIRKIFKKADLPFQIKNVRYQGYSLELA